MQNAPPVVQIHPATSRHIAMRPLDIVDVLEQLPPEVVGAMVLEQLEGDDIRSFKLVAPSTLALVRKTSPVLHLGRSHGQDTFPNRLDLEYEAAILAKYVSRMQVQLDVQSEAGISPLLVATSTHGCGSLMQPGPRNGNGCSVSPTLSTMCLLKPLHVPPR